MASQSTAGALHTNYGNHVSIFNYAALIGQGYRRLIIAVLSFVCLKEQLTAI